MLTGLEYLFVAQFFASLMLTVVFFLAWRTVEPRPHTLSWTILFGVATLQYCLNALANLLAWEGSARDVYWIVVNALSLCVQGLAWAGFRQRAGLRGWPRYLVAGLVVVELLVIWFTVVAVHQGLRMVLIPWSGTVLLAACAWTLLKPGRPLRPPEWGAATIFGLYSFAQIFVGAAALMQGAQSNEHYLEIYRQINFLALPAMFIGVGLFTVLIVADDLADRMRSLALSDQLTGVLNRRGFEQNSARAAALARRFKKPVCVAMADLDRFKAVNDGYGHAAGDRALRAFAENLVRGVRTGDIVARLGGDEFAMLLWADRETAYEIVERVRRQLTEAQLVSDGIRVPVTASFGVVSLAPDHHSVYEALKDADRALYKAKNAGGDQVAMHAAK